MADNGEKPTNPAAAGAEGVAAQPPQLKVLGQFVRDMSFENVMVQKGVQGEVTPDINVQVGLDAKKRQGENQYEVTTKYQIKSVNRNDDSTLFLLELEYGGLFQVDNVPENQLHPFLLIECPRMLFPFVRRLVADLTREGGFPPLNLDTVDFVAMYRNLVASQAQKQAEGQPVS